MIVRFVIISIKANGFYSNNEEFFTPKGIMSLMNNFYSAHVFNSLCRMNRDFSSGQNS